MHPSESPAEQHARSVAQAVVLSEAHSHTTSQSTSAISTPVASKPTRAGARALFSRLNHHALNLHNARHCPLKMRSPPKRRNCCAGMGVRASKLKGRQRYPPPLAAKSEPPLLRECVRARVPFPGCEQSAPRGSWGAPPRSRPRQDRGC